MKVRMFLAAGGLAAAAAAVAQQRLRRPSPDARERWRTVTIYVPAERAVPGGIYPAPLEALRQSVDLRTQPAPGDKGTEIAARPRPGAADGTVEKLRTALRQSKEILEAGEPLRNEPRPHGHRPSTAAGAVVDALERRSRGKGIL